nr:MAG TPA: hypothetical protein [Caudoviricetes sp.]
MENCCGIPTVLLRFFRIFLGSYHILYYICGVKQ